MDRTLRTDCTTMKPAWSTGRKWQQDSISYLAVVTSADIYLVIYSYKFSLSFVCSWFWGGIWWYSM